jgi:N-acetylglucosamine malate deacetylase 1
MDFTPYLRSLSKYFTRSSLKIKKPSELTVFILSPHPDDECITGSLALRLMHENGARVVNVAVTLGSNELRKKERMQELREACDLLELELEILSEDWKKKAKELKSLLQKYNPDLIIAPHLKDHHPTHIRTGELLRDVLLTMKKESFLVAWSEFWAPMTKPNLLVEVPIEIVNFQMQGLIKHKGEIERNPYHLRLPAWMMDNVRRGSEIISGKGEMSSPMCFGVLYQLQRSQKGKLSTIKLSQPYLDNKKDLGQIFKLILDAASGSTTSVK